MTTTTQLTTDQINAGLEIVALDGQLFATQVFGGKCYCYAGHSFYHKDLGYFAFEGMKLPYSPAGGKETLQEIIDAGGLLNFDTAVWIQEIK